MAFGHLVIWCWKHWQIGSQQIGTWQTGMLPYSALKHYYCFEYMPLALMFWFFLYYTPKCLFCLRRKGLCFNFYSLTKQFGMMHIDIYALCTISYPWREREREFMFLCICWFVVFMWQFAFFSSWTVGFVWLKTSALCWKVEYTI